MDDPISSPVFEIVEPLSAAEFTYFARARFWSNDEATCLALGVDPRCKEPAQRAFKLATGDKKRQLLRFIYDHARLKALLDRHFLQHDERNRTPRFWIDWLSQMKLPCPDVLVAAVAEYGGPAIDWKQRAERAVADLEAANQRIGELEKAIVDGTLKRETMLRVIVGIALEQYHYEPTKGRNTAAKQISEDLALHGISVTDDTIRKFLNEGAELLPPVDET